MQSEWPPAATPLLPCPPAVPPAPLLLPHRGAGHSPSEPSLVQGRPELQRKRSVALRVPASLSGCPSPALAPGIVFPSRQGPGPPPPCHVGRPELLAPFFVSVWRKLQACHCVSPCVGLGSVFEGFVQHSVISVPS